MKSLISTIALFLIVSTLFVSPALSQPESVFNTKYTRIHYSNPEDMSTFIWRLGGQKHEFTSDTSLASNRVDRIVQRVEAILDMRPGKFMVDLYLTREPLKENKIAFYDYNKKSIYISVDNVTDGVFAHEIAHAVIHHNFGTLLPSKMQEILTQYVDKYLWSDY